MATSVFPIASSSSGDPASQTFAAATTGTYTLGTPLAAGLYEITTSAFASNATLNLGFKTSGGHIFYGTIVGGKGFVSVPVTVTQVVIPAISWMISLNIRLTSFTQTTAPTSSSYLFTVGNTATFTFTAPVGATDIVAYYPDGTSTTFSTTTSPKTTVTVPGAANSQPNVILVAKDVAGVIGKGISLTPSNSIYIPFSGGSVMTYVDGGTNYFVNYFGASANLIVNNAGNYDIMLLAGGAGGGGNYNGARGGAGGSILAQTSRAISVGTYAVGIGGGGGPGGAGGSSTFNGLTATGSSGKNHSQADSGGATGSGTWTSSGIGGAGAGAASSTKDGGNGRNALGGFTFPTTLGNTGYFGGGGSGYQSGYGSPGLGTSFGAGGRALNNSGTDGYFIIRATV